MTHVVVLAEHNRGTKTLSKEEQSDTRRNLMAALKDGDALLKSMEKSSLNLSDFVVYSLLGCLNDQNTSKAMKGMKAYK